MSIESEYRRLRNNLNKRLNYARKNDIQYLRKNKSGNFEDIKIPEIPKKITAGSIRKLKKLNVDLNKNKYYRTPSGGITQNKWKRRKKADSGVSVINESSELAIQWFISEIIDNVGNDTIRIIISDWLKKCIDTVGRTETGNMLSKAIYSGDIVELQKAVSSGNVSEVISNLSTIENLMDLSQEQREALNENIDQEENFFYED